MPYNKLNPQEEEIIVNKGTEAPFSGEYDDFYEEGAFICRRCNAPLFSSQAKFDAGCGWPASTRVGRGWPSFDEENPNSLNRLPDQDGTRTEIQCSNCKAHLGHEFRGENLTEKNSRHCVNSLSIKFIPQRRKITSGT